MNIQEITPSVQVDENGEPTNEARATRIDVVLTSYTAAIGEEMGPVNDLDLSGLLADIRHWCDRNEVDFYQALDLSYQHYLAECDDALLRQLLGNQHENQAGQHAHDHAPG
jgi:hypothetical protein